MLSEIIFWAELGLGLGKLYKRASLTTHYEDY